LYSDSIVSGTIWILTREITAISVCRFSQSESRRSGKRQNRFFCS